MSRRFAMVACLTLLSLGQLAPKCVPDRPLEPELQPEMLAATSAIGQLPLAEPAVSMVRYTLVSREPITRFVYALEYRAELSNESGADLLTTAQLSTTHPDLSIVDGRVEFGTAPHSAFHESSDTFTIHHDRSGAPFDGDDLEWDFDAVPQVAITTEAANAAEATIDSAGGVLGATASDGTTYTLSVPAGALAAATSVRITPISSITGTAFAEHQLGGVVGEPTGLAFATPATLSVDLGAPAPPRIHAVLSRDDGLPLEIAFASTSGDTFEMELNHFSPATGSNASAANTNAADAACSMVERGYYGLGGIHDRLRAVDSCDHPDLANLASDIVDLVRAADILPQGGSCTFAQSQSCWHPSWLPPGEPAVRCTNNWQTGEAARDALHDVLRHTFLEDDFRCSLGLVDQSVPDECVDLAHQLEPVLPASGDEFALWDTLLGERACGLHDIELSSPECLAPAEMLDVTGRLIDVNGHTVSGEIAWQASPAEVVTVAPNRGATVTATTVGPGVGLVSAFAVEDPVYIYNDIGLRVVDLSGFWEATDVVDGHNCGEPLTTTTEIVEIVQTGRQFEIITSEGPLQGTLETTYTARGEVDVCRVDADFSVPVEWGVVYGTIELPISFDGTTLTGTVPWTYSEPGFSCTGTTDLTLVRPEPPPPPDSELLVQRMDGMGTPASIKRAETIELQGVVVDADGNTFDESDGKWGAGKFLWRSSDPDILLVDGEGKMHGVSAGQAALTLHYRDLTRVLPITVQSVPLVDRVIPIHFSTRLTGFPEIGAWRCELVEMSSDPLVTNVYWWLASPGFSRDEGELGWPFVSGVFVYEDPQIVAEAAANPPMTYWQTARFGVNSGYTNPEDLYDQVALIFLRTVPEGERKFHAFELTSVNNSGNVCFGLSGRLHVYADHVANAPWSIFHHDVTTALPYQPDTGNAPTRIHVNTTGSNRAWLSQSNGFALEARAVSPSLAEFDAGPNWAVINRSHPNAISQSSDPSFIAYEIGVQGFYQIDPRFSIDPDLNEVVIDELEVWYCDTWTECPGFAGLPAPGQ